MKLWPTKTSSKETEYTRETLSAKEHLQRVNEEIYKRNADLAVRNKTLSLLRQLYEITTLTLESDELATRLVERIQSILNFKLVGIFIVDEEQKNLIPFAASFSGKSNDKTQIHSTQKEYKKLRIPLSSQNNICARALRSKQPKQTEKLSEIVAPFFPESTISTIQKNSPIQTSLIYPLLIENKQLGILVFALQRQANDLTVFEKESIKNLVNIVAVALDKAILYGILKSTNEKLTESIQKEVEQREELEQLTYKLERANEELKVLDKAKSEFVSIASHQLRTPLTAIKGYLSLALEGSYGPLSAKLKRPIQNVYNSNERLVRLINDLLSVSRIESGKIKLEPGKANLVEIIKSVVDELALKAQDKRLELAFVEPASYPNEITIDAEKIRNVVLNLIDNSIKYTQRGSVTAAVEFTPGKVHISVSDTGAGMEQEEIQKLFESFSRGRAGKALSTEGIGLGLYIAKKFVLMHKGTIWAESPGKGKGSSFHVELPMK